jgi:hypothetical protein
VSGHRLDDEKLDTLRSWGAGLSADGRDELRAAGKAILILVEEIDRLQVDLWRRRDAEVPSADGDAPMPAAQPPEDVSAGYWSDFEPDTAIDTTLRSRVGRLLGTRAAKRD